MMSALDDDGDTMREGGPNGPVSGVCKILGKTYVEPDHLARLLRVSRRTLARWDDARTGPPKIKIGNKILYDLDKLNTWLASREIGPIGDPYVAQVTAKPRRWRKSQSDG